MPAVWQRAWGVHTEHDATSWSFSARGRRNRARAYSRMASSSRILEETADGDYRKHFTPKGIRIVLSRLADKLKHRLYALNKEFFWNKMFFSVKNIFHILKISMPFCRYFIFV